jgi:RHS repeat-associated protein
VTDEYAYVNGRTLERNGESDTDLHFDDPARPGVLAGMTTAGGPRVPILHDADGNVTALPGRTFAWNAKSELARVDRTDGTVGEYVHDHRGSRVRKTVRSGGLTTDTVLLGDAAEVRNGQLAFFVTLGRQQIAVVSGGATRWIHTDQLGSATFFTDPAGNRIARIAYRPFGNAPGTATTADQVFALHAFDAEAGLYAMRRRYYDPVLGRFLSADGLYLHDPERAITDPRRFALYTYVGNDPVNNVDPTGNSFWSVVGAIVGVVVGVIAAVVLVAALAIGFWAVVLAIAAIALVMVIGYVLASNANPNSAWGQFLRGFFLGMNAGLNAGLLTAMGAGVLGIVVGVVLFLGAFDTIANNEVYQGIIGWGNWVMPTSWPIVALGAVFFILNALPWIFTFGQVDAVALTDFKIDWKTGTINVQGGWISDLNQWNTAFNMGNFAFVDSQGTSIEAYLEHEAGHTLNLAAFGSIFHLIGFVDEVILGNGGNAYAEQLAESNDPSATGPTIPMWV